MKTMKAIALSTVDNPYNPFTQFREWFNFDNEHNYNCCSIVARITETSNDLLLSEQNLILEAAINKFVEADPIGLYCKVTNEIEIEMNVNSDSEVSIE